MVDTFLDTNERQSLQYRLLGELAAKVRPVMHQSIAAQKSVSSPLLSKRRKSASPSRRKSSAKASAGKSPFVINKLSLLRTTGTYASASLKIVKKTV